MLAHKTKECPECNGLHVVMKYAGKSLLLGEKTYSSEVCPKCNGAGEIKADVKSNILFDFWACQRPLTRKWGSGQVFERINKNLGKPDVAFGKTDNIPDRILYIDKSNGYNWLELPFEDNYFEFGYWDPPYDKLYKHEGIEIWRCSRRLAILHTHIFPKAWLHNAKREAMIAVTFGPLKQIRCLQVFRKKAQKNVES